MARLPKEDVVWGRGCIRDWGFTIADVCSAKANVGEGRGCEGSGSVILGFRGAGVAGKAR